MQKTPEYTNTQTNIQRIGDGYTLFGYADSDGVRHCWTLQAKEFSPGIISADVTDGTHIASVQQYENVILRYMKTTQPTFYWSIPV